ncbi:MAG: beta,4-N-acetylglucosaminyltransferase [Solirubrobacteraceae bacterium]|jgi:UDP-N-acetylglucosamine:LPS N-acetylglucosamine transferase|nr:beta,4-N-acetylglucosaminyltransferase [Solirubrobacteraceae bacterium]MEA2395625.1 beta,4-N-acetylglucosaminyltransferase [Solirubrobacteraceae bacterium]
MRRRSRSRGGPLLLVCSSGGHLLQLVGLRAAFEGFERVWVTFDKPDATALLAGERVVHAHGPTNRDVPNLLRNLRLARRVLARERPSAIVSTGAGVAVPFAWLGRLMGIPIVYVESVTRIDSLSLSGRMIAPVAADVFVQWPELAATVPGSRYAGSSLAAA